MSPALEGTCTVSQNVPSGLTVSIVYKILTKHTHSSPAMASYGLSFVSLTYDHILPLHPTPTARDVIVRYNDIRATTIPAYITKSFVLKQSSIVPIPIVFFCKKYPTVSILFHTSSHYNLSRYGIHPMNIHTVCCVLFSLHHSAQEIHLKYLPIVFKVASLALGKS